MGIVEDVGSDVTRVKRGDRVVIACGACYFCERQLFACCETTNDSRGALMNKKSLRPGAAMFGYTHLYGGVPGGQSHRQPPPRAGRRGARLRVVRQGLRGLPQGGADTGKTRSKLIGHADCHKHSRLQHSASLPMILSTPDPLSMLTLRDLQRPAAARPPLRPCLFVDRDGTLVEDAPYNANPLLLRFMPGAGEALARLQRTGLALVLVTNQSGLARGRFTRAEFARLQQVLLQRLQTEFGVRIDSAEVCPHAPDDEGRPACLCRMPAPGMLIRAAQRHGLDLARSWMIGDTLDDVEAGHRAGCQGLLLDSGGETVWRRSPLREPDARFFDWTALADYVEKLLDARTPTIQPAPRGLTNYGTVPAHAWRQAV
jgi:D-glycero-D-manno-heptose 1,7-bisphosphate phosphatase